MILTNTEKQARWRAKQKVKAAKSLEVKMKALLKEVDGAKKTGIAPPEQILLADKIADTAMTYLHTAQALAKLARGVRSGNFDYD